MTAPRLAIKVDVDTDRGTSCGVPALRDCLERQGLPATFLLSLGPDNTGRSIRRIFRPGFFKKAQRTNVLEIYGLRTLMNGIVIPGPNIARRNGDVMRSLEAAGFEVGIHCWDHVYWQDKLHVMTRAQVFAQLRQAMESFESVFKHPAHTAGTAGWQANALSLEANDAAGFDYASDCRGTTPFFPSVAGRVFATLQIPTTLPTLDELLGRPEFPRERLIPYLLSELDPGRLNVLTAHAEIEGMLMLDWFEDFVATAKREGVAIVAMKTEAERLLKTPQSIPVMELSSGEVDGRSGTLAVQGAPLDIVPVGTAGVLH